MFDLKVNKVSIISTYFGFFFKKVDFYKLRAVLSSCLLIQNVALKAQLQVVAVRTAKEVTVATQKT